MSKVIVSEFVTLDGVMQDPGGSGEFAHGGWSWPYWGDDLGAFKLDELRASGALLLGRVTYQGFAAAWPSMTDEQGFAERMNSLPKHVVSTTLTTTTWNNSHLIKEHVVDAITALKAQPGQDILVSGSGKLVQMLMRHDLVDEYRLLVHPVAVGNGNRLFTDANPTALTLVDTRAFGSGVVLLQYRPTGQPATE